MERKLQGDSSWGADRVAKGRQPKPPTELQLSTSSTFFPV